MSSRSKRTKSVAPGTSTRTERISGWERSRFSTVDLRKLKKMGLLTNGELTRIPGDEAVPNPLEGGVCICVRPDVGYFDLKFADSVQGWRKKWLYIKDESNGAQLYGLSPVDPSQEILRRKSWDAEATPEEIAATESLVLRIKALQNTSGQELSGVQILAYFLRVRVQPLQARATPLWMYSGTGDSARISADLPVGELEKLVRRFTSLTKNEIVPTTCRVEPFSATHPLPSNHQILSQLPPLPEDGEVVERFIIDDESQDASTRAAEPASTEKSAGLSDKLTESAGTRRNILKSMFLSQQSRAHHIRWSSPKGQRLFPKLPLDEDIPTTPLPPSLIDEDEPAVKLKSNEVRIGPITRARAKLLKQQRRRASHERGEADMKTDVKMDVKLDMELDMKISHGRARRREACARGEEDVQPVQHRSDRPRPPTRPDPVDRANRTRFIENKSAADIITWREYEALRNEMRREFRAQDDELKETVQAISQKLDATHVTVTTMQDQMTDVQRSLALRLAVENLTAQQQQDNDDDLEFQDDAHNARGAPRGNRPRGWVPLGRNGRGHDEEDGLGKPKFSIPKFEGGADVEEYLTWELKIEKLWSLHPHYTEERKVKLASSEFDGYALRWWDAFVRNRDEDGEQPIRTWYAMKEAMTSRFVPTNYLRNIYDKLTLLRQGVKTVDEYYMEMEMLMQRGRVRESLEMTMQRFLNGLNKDQRTSYRSWAFHTTHGPIYGTGAFDALRPLLYYA
ncbi:hypothetical protein QYE76_036827 [Lolium multiflorum]|uniref:Retrotransposon gag domain-containing protein n=1 Tax=Lolium multiflorum TaxID=4521 RepID=A0AAD8R559_LOLMU|nr:hypothetical protein QYE76_036827 [Lolium multiflorum]